MVEEELTVTRITQEELEPDRQYSYREDARSSSSDQYDPDSYEARREARRRLREERHKQMEELSAEGPAKSEYQPQRQVTTERLVTPEEEPERQATPQEEQKGLRENAEPKENGLGERTATEDKNKESVYELDSYEARREARRKAREEKLKNAGQYKAQHDFNPTY